MNEKKRKKMWYIYTQWSHLYSAIKKMKNFFEGK
jgi:hypothetical protein